jgi:hypothetical protein
MLGLCSDNTLTAFPTLDGDGQEGDTSRPAARCFHQNATIDEPTLGRAGLSRISIAAVVRPDAAHQTVPVPHGVRARTG